MTTEGATEFKSTAVGRLKWEKKDKKGTTDVPPIQQKDDKKEEQVTEPIPAPITEVVTEQVTQDIQTNPVATHYEFKKPRETRSKKTGFLMKPSIYEAMKEEARIAGVSLNDIEEAAVTQYIEQCRKKRYYI